MNHKFKLDNKKCIKCHKCINDCITGALDKDENDYPKMKKPLNCIECQHCFAICPNGAISIMGKNPDNAFEITKNIKSEDLLNLIQSRRSVRKFKQINVSKEEIEKLKQMLNYVPTGCNNHKLHFSFIEDIEVMDDFRLKVNNKIKNYLNKQSVNYLVNKMNTFSKYKDAFLEGDDVIFRGAPHLVVVSNSINAPTIKEDGIIALTYFELYAQSLGLSTLWCGFAYSAIKIFSEFSEYLQIPSGYKPIYVMLFGYGDEQYQRTTLPKEYEFKTIEKQDLNVSFFKKIKRTFWNFIR